MNLDPKAAILDDFARVTRELGYVPTRDEYCRALGLFSERQVEKYFGSYAALKLAASQDLQTSTVPCADRVPVRDPAAFVKLTQPSLAAALSEGRSAADFIADKIAECAKARGVPPYNLTWFDFREFIQMAFGQNQVGITPRDITRCGGFNAIRDAYFPPDASQASVDRQKIREHARLNRKLGEQAVRFEDLLEQIEHFSERVFSGKVHPFPNVFNPRSTERVITAMLSDLHFGSNVKRSETGALDYGTLQEARRAAFVFSQICDYKIEYRDESELELLLMGDIIQGSLHDPRDGAALAEQICRAIHILVQGVALCANSYKAVRVRCTPGNHGRDKARHPGRAVHEKVLGALETVAYFAIKKACANLSNVTFDIPLTPFGSYEVFGRKILFTHGDSVLNPGNPGKTIKIESLESQINRINAALPDVHEYAAVLLGHVHTASMVQLPNGTVFMTNGALVPVDPFAVSIGLLESACSQWIFESVPGYPVGDARLIRVDRRTDECANLDAVIRPWDGFDK